MRTFIAIEIPEQLRKRLTSVRAELAARLADDHFARLLRWSGEEKYHLTLRFLGDTTPVQRQAIGAMLGKVTANHPPFALTLDGLGAFPNWRKMRVLWVGIVGDVALLGRLQAEIELGVCGCGFAAERAAFHPHATLARVSREADLRWVTQAGDLLATQKAVTQSLGHWTVSELVLMRSDLQPGGAIYTVLERFHLNG